MENPDRRALPSNPDLGDLRRSCPPLLRWQLGTRQGCVAWTRALEGGRNVDGPFDRRERLCARPSEAAGIRNTEQQLQFAAIFIVATFGVLPVHAPTRGLAATMAHVVEVAAAATSREAGWLLEQRPR